jgi:hypothetical protein
MPCYVPARDADGGREVDRVGHHHRLTRSFATLLIALAIAGCGGMAAASPVRAPSSPAPDTSTIVASSPPSVGRPSASNPASAAATADIVGSWTRVQTCQEELAAFQQAGLASSEAYQWVTSNWVANASPRTSGFCDGAAAPTKHTHFFTADGTFGSRDANGQQVDDGDYTITAPGVLTFPTHASDFHYSGPTSVRYSIVGIELMFDVQVPPGCAKDPACADAYGWALSAFFKGKAWTRS